MIDNIRSLVDRECSEVYKSPEARAAYRAGLGAAAIVCDLMSAAFSAKNEIERKQKLAAKLCGDHISELRDKIKA